MIHAKENKNENRHAKFGQSSYKISTSTENPSRAHTQERKFNKHGKFEPSPYVTQPHDSKYSRKNQAHRTQ